jgi:hypothetical protein
MDFNSLAYLLGFMLLILIVSRFIKDDDSYSKSITSIGPKEVNESSELPVHKNGTSNLDVAFNNIVDFLQNEVSLRYGKNKDEKNYQQELDGKLAVLNERYGYKVHYEAVNGKHRLDFVINGNIGIEMKVHRGGTQVEKELYNQITDYSRYCPKLIGLVVNTTNDDARTLQKSIKNKLQFQHAIKAKDYEIIVLNV